MHRVFSTTWECMRVGSYCKVHWAFTASNPTSKRGHHAFNISVIENSCSMWTLHNRLCFSTCFTHWSESLLCKERMYGWLVAKHVILKGICCECFLIRHGLIRLKQQQQKSANTHICIHISKIQLYNLLFLLILSFLFSSILPFSLPVVLLLERIRCSQRMKLGTSCFKCCLAWLLYINMVRSFPLPSFSCSTAE